MINYIMISFFLGCVVYCVVQYIINTTLLHPTYGFVTDYETLQHNIKKVQIESNGELLSGFLKLNTNTNLFMIFFGGNKTVLSERLDIINGLAEHYNVLAVDYRGYGESSGTPNYYNIVEDAKVIYNYVVSKLHVEPHNIVVCGFSLGGAVAAQLVYEINNQIGGIILINTFSSVYDMACERVKYARSNPLVKYFVWLFTSHVLNTNSVLKQINQSIPSIIIHEQYDSLIPVNHAIKNCHTRTKCKFTVNKDGTHGTFPNYDQLVF